MASSRARLDSKLAENRSYTRLHTVGTEGEPGRKELLAVGNRNAVLRVPTLSPCGLSLSAQPPQTPSRERSAPKFRSNLARLTLGAGRRPVGGAGGTLNAQKVHFVGTQDFAVGKSQSSLLHGSLRFINTARALEDLQAHRPCYVRFWRSLEHRR